MNENECEFADLDPKEVLRISKGLSRYVKQANNLGLTVFGGSGTGQLRLPSNDNGDLIVCFLDGRFDGGAGDAQEDQNGLLRGEY